jgi:hypothetical protein
MKKLLDLPLFDTLAHVSAIDFGRVLTVEQGMRYLMFMEEIARELESTGLESVSLDSIHIYAKNNSMDGELSPTQFAIYCRLADKTYQLLR